MIDRHYLVRPTSTSIIIIIRPILFLLFFIYYAFSFFNFRTTLARWRAAQVGDDPKVQERRPYLASECNDLAKAEKWRMQIIREIAKKVAQIQNGMKYPSYVSGFIYVVHVLTVFLLTQLVLENFA